MTDVVTKEPNHDAMVLDLVLSFRKGMFLVEHYPIKHGNEGRATLRERLSDLTNLGESVIVRELVHELHNKGIPLSQ